MKENSYKLCLLTVLLVMVVVALIITLIVINRSRTDENKQPILQAREHIVAVYEHAPISGKPTNREEALRIIRENADVYSHQVILAKSQGAELIVFPEYGLTGYISKPGRSALYPYMQRIPDVYMDDSHSSRCDYTDESDIVNSISLLARNASLYVIVNLLEQMECGGLDTCQYGDGLRIYNTNVIFDPQGCIVGKYHKYHMYGDERRTLDKPEFPEHVYIDTPLGRLGTFVCFDGAFKEPSLTLVNTYHIDTILFPTLWTMADASTRLYQNIIEYSSGWAKRQNVNFLAANIRSHEHNCYGSAIATPNGLATAYYQPNSTAGKLLVAKIQRSHSNNDNSYYQEIPDRKSGVTHYSVVTTVDGRSYHVQTLNNINGTVNVCHQKLCCNVEYQGKSGSDQMILAAYSWFLPTNVSHKDSPRPVSLEVCLLQTCKTDSLESCLEFPISQSSIKFDKVVLSGYFVSEYVYPMVVGSEYQVTGFDWTYSYSESYNQIEMSGVDVPIQNAGLQTFY